MDGDLRGLIGRKKTETADRYGMQVELVVTGFAIDRFKVSVEGIGFRASNLLAWNAQPWRLCSNHRYFVVAGRRTNLDVAPQCSRGIGLEAEPSGLKAMRVSH